MMAGVVAGPGGVSELELLLSQGREQAKLSGGRMMASKALGGPLNHSLVPSASIGVGTRMSDGDGPLKHSAMGPADDEANSFLLSSQVRASEWKPTSNGQRVVKYSTSVCVYSGVYNEHLTSTHARASHSRDQSLDPFYGSIFEVYQV